jgi:hypothetical protein
MYEASKYSQKYPYRVPLFTMIRIIAAIQLIYNKKVQPDHFYTRKLNFYFTKLFNEKKTESSRFIYYERVFDSNEKKNSYKNYTW